MDEEIKGILTQHKNVAVVGMSKNPLKPSHYVSRFLIEHGYNVIPVNSTADVILGRKSYKSLLEVPENIEVVGVFRRSEDVPLHAEEAVKRGVRVFWMQESIYSKESAQLLRGAGITVVWDRCVMKEHSRLFGSKMRVPLGKL